jgi:hypothetical protein
MFIKQLAVAGVMVFGVVSVSVRAVKRDKVVCKSRCVDSALLVWDPHCVRCDKLIVLGSACVYECTQERSCAGRNLQHTLKLL